MVKWTDEWTEGHKTDSWVDAIQSGELVLEIGGPGEAALKIEIHSSPRNHMSAFPRHGLLR